MLNLFKFKVLSDFFFFPPQHYPDYYAIIKEPIDLRTIAQRIQVVTSVFSVCCVCSNLPETPESGLFLF